MPATSGFAQLFSAESWMQWFSELDRAFVFLLVLPFVVAMVGLWSYLNDRDRDKDEE